MSDLPDHVWINDYDHIWWPTSEQRGDHPSVKYTKDTKIKQLREEIAGKRRMIVAQRECREALHKRHAEAMSLLREARHCLSAIVTKKELDDLCARIDELPEAGQ
jgi:hypothetical protein